MKKVLFILSVLTIGIWACSKGGDPAPNDPVPPTPEQDYVNTFYPSEVKPSSYSPCFAGAYYRKAVSSNDVWTGIEGTVVLPTITFDPNRVNPAKPKQFLDNPSVYMGGRMGGQETDIGMTWEVIKDAQGNV